MNVPRLTASVTAALAVVLGLAAELSAESCKLEMKRVDSTSRVISVTGSADYLFRQTYPQSFFMQIRDIGSSAPVVQSPDQAEFSKVITKEPAEYVSKHPFRGVAKLGTQQYGFVFDTVATPKKAEADEDAEAEKKTEKKAELLGTLAAALDAEPSLPSEQAQPKVPAVEQYNRLLFDLNHNGDLTDDEPIKALGVEGRIMYPSGYSSYSFPRQDLTIEVDGTKVDYSFTFRIYARTSTSYQYASASLNAAAYREGTITLDGKERRIVLIDFNSNGRFDDVFTVRDDVQTADGTVYPNYGDMLFVDPEVTPGAYRSPYDPTTNDDQYYLARLVNLDGKLYDLTVTPSGEELTLERSKLPMGTVTNPNKGYRAVVYGDQGFVKIAAGETQEVPLPVGTWKLLAYTIDQTELAEQEAEKPAAEEESKKEDEQAKKEKESSLLDSLVGALMGGASKAVETRVERPRTTIVCARGTKDYKPVEVREGETALLPFGPPYHPLVTAPYRSGTDTVSLAMAVIGSAGEQCSNLMVDGGRPSKPTFTITSSKGEEVETGNFEYG
jgi:hypothetical protein